MNLSFNKKVGYEILLLILSVLVVGCAGSAKFEKKIQGMSNDELIRYYQGIEARLKDIESGGKENDRLFKKSHDETSVNMKTSYYWGGEGQDLIRKRNAVVKEIDRRSISPNR